MNRRSGRALIAALACVAAVISLLVFGTGALADRSPGEPAQGLYVFDPSASSPKLLVASEEDDPAWSPDGRWIQAFDANDYFINVVNPDGNVRHRAGSISWSPNRSRVAYTSTGQVQNLFVGSTDWSAAKLVKDDVGETLAWAPDSRRFAFSTHDTLVVAASDGTHARTILTHDPLAALWSPTGRLIAVTGRDAHEYLVPSSGGRALQLPGGEWDVDMPPLWFPNGKSILGYRTVNDANGGVGGYNGVKFNVSGGPSKVVCKRCQDFFPSPDGRSIAFTDASNQVWVVKSDWTGRRLVAKKPLSCCTWSADSRQLVLALPGKTANVSTIAVADLATGQVRRLTDGTHPDSPDSGLSPDGRFVAFDRYSDQGSELWIMKSDGTQTRKVMSFGTCSLAVWAPKGALLAVTNLDDC